MCIVFVLGFPAGSLALRVWNKVKVHAILQTVALVLFIMGFAGGAVVSGQYIRSKHFNSAHQIIGILLLIAFLAQLALGAMHHAKYKKDQQPTLMGKIHRFLGPAIMLVGLMNGYIGFAFAGNIYPILSHNLQINHSIPRPPLP